ncbi:MAG TPA: DUF1800 domain-containing protein, partial [Acidimicrobiales bacterium]|nr:DUF1800 domain-containing protein [Acidimicrobiales bacterium]
MSELERGDQPGRRPPRADPGREPAQRRPGDVGGVVLIDPEPAETHAAHRRTRRMLLAGLAGVGAAAAVAGTRRTGDGLAEMLDRARAAQARRSADTAAGSGGYANRDESYAQSMGGRMSAEHEPGPTLVFPTAGEAAAATAVTVPTILDTSDPALHLLRRTTFGLTPELVDEVHTVGIDAWLAAQLDPAAIPDPEGDLAWGAYPLAGADPATVRARVRRSAWDASIEVSAATLARQIWSRRQLFEVVVDFWANHLNVPTPGPGSWDVGGSYHRDVIRTHALGSFTDMLLAAGRHPATLRYLTADQSTKDSVNENYGRELLELHTVGVASGYTEDDVRNSAYILTGRTEISQYDAEQGRGQAGTFVYDPGKHWTGAVKVLDFQHANGAEGEGFDVGDAYLRHLAGHPATAQAIARKLAVRFVSDMPPGELVDRLAETYLAEGTAIVPVLSTLFRSAEFWA